VELEPSGAVLGALHAALNAPEVGSVVDAFAGTGFLTLWIAAQQRRGFAKQNLRLVMNELDQYRHNTLKTVQQHPEHVKQALGDLMQQIKHLYYRTFHNHPIADMVNGRDDRKFDEALARRLAAQAGLSVPSMTTEQLLALLNKTVEDWVGTAVIDVSTNAKFSTALKDYIVGHIDCPLPPAPENPGADDIRQRARNAAIYLLAQHNGHMPSNPINFSRSVGSRPNQHPSGILVGSKGSIQSRMLVSATILNKARREAKDTSRVTKLSMDLNFRPDSGGKDTMFHNLPLHIDQVSDALTGVDIQRGDGWELLHSLRKDAFALIDPPYWADKKKSASLKVYNNGSRDDFSKARFLNMVDQIVMPAWKEGARMIMFNRLDDDIAHEMKSRGFDVTALLNINRMSRDNSNLTEFMAVNFNIDSNATLRPFIAHPSPAAPLAAPADASSEDESDKSDETP
jgi:site-specific DNA-adenine methylase